MTEGPIAAALAAMPLVDHHVHPVLAEGPTAAEFELLLTESGRPGPPGTTWFDSQLGLAVRRWCGPVLGVAAGAPPGEYLARRAALGAAATARLLLRASGVGHYLVDTGYARAGMCGLAEMAEWAGSPAAEIVRLESLAERALGSGDGTAAGFAGRFAAALWDATAQAAGVKSIAAYRHGLDLDPDPPSDAEVTAAAGEWLRETEGGGAVRLTSPVLLRHLLWAGIGRGLPVQIHTGFGDRDADLRLADPLLLRGFLERTEARGVPVMLLHCYPYHRHAGHLAHSYAHVHIDVGLALNYVGARAAAVVAESMELAPFAKVLFSSDAYALPELHYLGAVQWRRATAAVLGEWAASGDWSTADATRVAAMIGAGNARRVYGLP